MSDLKLKTAPGYQVLAAAGKKILRPGGYAATQQLLTWADFQPGDIVLELAPGLGHSAIALAQQYGVRVVGLEKNPDTVAIARANVAAAGLSEKIEILEGNISYLAQMSNEKFDYVIAEAILTMQSATAKAKVLDNIFACLKPNGQFLSHELCLNSSTPKPIVQDLSKSIRVNASPLSTQGWIEACIAAGLTVEAQEHGPMRLLNPRQIAKEEGISTLFTMAWNMLTRPILRKRILSMRGTFTRHIDNLGYVVMSAKKLSCSLQAHHDSPLEPVV